MNEVTLKIKTVLDSKGLQQAVKEIDGVKSATASAGQAAQKSNGLFSNFIGGLTRIAKLRLLRGIIRMVTQAFKEGTENIYYYSQALGSADASHFASTMNELASSFLYLKNSIGAVVAPLLSALLPALQTIVSWVALALDYLAQFFAVINGQSTYTRAKKQATAWKDVGSAAGGAAAAAKEYKNTIMSFDEIHALNDTPESGGGGGGGASAPDYSDMFEEVELGKNIFTSLGKLFSKDGIIGQGLEHIMNVGTFITESISPALSYLWGAITGDIEMCNQAWQDLQKAFASNTTVQKIMGIALKAWQGLSKFFDDIEWAFWDMLQRIINDLSPFLELIGIDVDELTRKIENNKQKVEEHGAKTAGFVAYFKAWMSGLDETTAHAVGDTVQATVAAATATSSAIKSMGEAKDKAMGVSKEVKNTSDAWGAYSSAVYNAERTKYTGDGVTGGMRDVYNATDTVYWKIYQLRTELGYLNGTTVHYSVSGTLHGGGGFSWANGGFVMKQGGIIPRFDNGGINTAQLFIANENGQSELIGNIGNRTAVANQSQMIDMVSEGVYRAVSEAMNSGNSNVEVIVNMDSETVARAADKGNRSLNRRFSLSLA